MRILCANWPTPGGPDMEQARYPDVTFDIWRNPPEAETPAPLESCRLADAVINYSAVQRFGRDPDAFDRCRIVVRAGVGFDNIDIAGWSARGVPVCNVPDYGTTEVADHALGLTLALVRGTATYHDAIRSEPGGGWSFAAAPAVRRLRGAVFGIVGLGRIGLAAARRAAAFDMQVVFYDPYLPNGVDLATGFRRVGTLTELLAISDILSIHAPLTDETRGLIGAAELASLKPGAIVVNTARGPIIDIDALYDALRDGRVAAAGLDVLPKEPADASHPLIAAWRAREPWLEGRLTISPHAAFYSPSALEDLRMKSVEVVVAYLRDGRLMNCVNGFVPKRN